MLCSCPYCSNHTHPAKEEPCCSCLSKLVPGEKLVFLNFKAKEKSPGRADQEEDG